MKRKTLLVLAAIALLSIIGFAGISLAQDETDTGFTTPFDAWINRVAELLSLPVSQVKEAITQAWQDMGGWGGMMSGNGGMMSGDGGMMSGNGGMMDDDMMNGSYEEMTQYCQQMMADISPESENPPAPPTEQTQGATSQDTGTTGQQTPANTGQRGMMGNGGHMGGMMGMMGGSMMGTRTTNSY